MTVYVFTGPTLTADEGREILDAVYLPPVAQGDVYLAARKQPRAIGIIDGFFERVPSVWHKEILWAMAQGIHVFGSASMGALRAVELEPFGMEGVGAIYEAYRNGTIEDDDEVSVVHGPASMEYRGGSEAMVNIRFTLHRAERSCVISQSTCAALLDIAKALFYPDRSYARVLEAAVERGLPMREIETLQAWLPGGQVNQKRDDARAMLCLMRERLEGDLPPKQVGYTVENTRIWNHATSLAGALPETEDGPGSVLATALLEEVRLEGLYSRAVRGGLLRHLALKVAEQQRVVVTAEMLQETGDRWRDEHSLVDLAAFQAWLETRDLTIEEFSRLLRNDAMRRMVERASILDTRLHLPDELLLSGHYDHLWTRAEDKQRVLDAHGLQNPGPEDLGRTWDEVLRWHFEERVGGSVPNDLVAYSRENGFEHELDFRRAVIRDYCYMTLRGEQPLQPVDGPHLA